MVPRVARQQLRRVRGEAPPEARRREKVRSIKENTEKFFLEKEFTNFELTVLFLSHPFTHFFLQQRQRSPRRKGPRKWKKPARRRASVVRGVREIGSGIFLLLFSQGHLQEARVAKPKRRARPRERSRPQARREQWYNDHPADVTRSCLPIPPIHLKL